MTEEEAQATEQRTVREAFGDYFPDDPEIYRDFFENAAVPMHWVGSNGIVLRANQAELDALGYSREEYVGHHIADFYADQDVIEDILARLSAGEVLRDYEARMVRKDGSIRHVLIDSSVHWDEGEFLNTRCVTRDVTERMQLQTELEETVERLQQSNERLREFAYAASHDLQEPLRMVTSYLQLLDRRYTDGLDADAREYIDFAVDGAQRMRELVNDLLEYAEIEQDTLQLEPVDCEAIIDRVLDDLRVQIDDADATIVVGSLPTVQANANQLETLVQNLVANALKYNEEVPHIEITAEESEAVWTFSVRDNGIGIDPDRTEWIFGLFKRLHADDAYPGTGIGLTLCQKIVENHGGDIWVQSEVGDGSTFSFTIPKAGTSRCGR